jgi:hypothetical protein
MSQDVLSRWMAAMRAGDFEEAWRQTDRIELPAARRLNEREDSHAVRSTSCGMARLSMAAACSSAVNMGSGTPSNFCVFAPLLRRRGCEVILKVPADVARPL